MDMDEFVTSVVDRMEILELLNAYCRHVDLYQPDEAAALFVSSCLVDYGPGLSPAGPIRSRSALSDLLRGMTIYSATSHHLSNISITINGRNDAVGISYVYAWHRFADQPREDAIVWGQYHDVFQRVAGQWQIKERVLRVAGSEGFSLTVHPIGRTVPPAGSEDSSIGCE